MRLKTKLVLSAIGLTFAIVLVLSALFVGELLRQRIDQTVKANDVLVNEVWMMTRQAVETGLRANPPVDTSDEALHAAVVQAVRNYQPLADTMSAILRYSDTILDVSVTDARGVALVSTDPDALNQVAPWRMSLESLQSSSAAVQAKNVFGAPTVFDMSQTLDRNGHPFLVVHVGVRSSFVRNSYESWLRDALIFALIAALVAMLAAGLLANIALRPIEEISSRLEKLTLPAGVVPPTEEEIDEGSDAMVRVARTIDLLGEQMRSKEAGYTALQSNLNQVLETLRDGVLLFTSDGRAVMVSEAAAFFLNSSEQELVGRQVDEIFDPETALGAAVLAAFACGEQVSAQDVMLEDSREVQISLDWIEDHAGAGSMGALLTLRDTETAMQLGQELEISRRLAAIGRLTAGVGHEVKNPINAMVVHLELLRTKLKAGGLDPASGAERHVEILSNEMQRLDRVVETLADFSRPMELTLREHDLRETVEAVVELTAVEMQETGVRVALEMPAEPVTVLIDAELIRQALLNLLLNGMQAMPEGGTIRVAVHREHQFAVVEVEDEGEGIPAELLPRIFELYFTTKVKGSGIGLAMTYRILQMHGGALDVRSNADLAAPDHGTKFTLRLPTSATPSVEPRKAGVVSGRRMTGEQA